MTSKTYVMLLGDSTGLDQSCERTFFERVLMQASARRPMMFFGQRKYCKANKKI